jgi:hypothetical protein
MRVRGGAVEGGGRPDGHMEVYHQTSFFHEVSSLLRGWSLQQPSKVLYQWLCQMVDVTLWHGSDENRDLHFITGAVVI